MKSRAFVILSFLAFLLSANRTTLAQTSSAANSPRSSLVADYGKLPLSFEANQGQSDPSVKFLSHGNSYSLFLTNSAAVLVLSKIPAASITAGHRSNPISATKPAVGDVVRMELIGAKSNPHVSGAEQLPGKANYVLGNDQSKWRSGIPTYAKVRYSGVYPGVDLVYYGNQRQLEYDFIVAPNADPKPLRLHFQGAQRLSVARSGDLTVKARNGEIAFHKPVVYQLKDGVREPVEGRFQILANNSTGFSVGSYDHSRELIIDPQLAYSTYLGGTGQVSFPLLPLGPGGPQGMALDSAGNVYVVGTTGSAAIPSDFPVTAGAFQTENGATLSGKPTAFIAKLNPSLSAVIYATYLGGSGGEDGSGGDDASGIAVDSAGNAYVTGSARSCDFPVTSGAFQAVNRTCGVFSPPSTNAFIAKLNATGSALLYSTYLGGSNGNGGCDFNFGCYPGDSAVGIAIDSSGNAYIAGNALSTDFPVTSNAYQKVNNAAARAAHNLFITKLNPQGTALVYSTYLGGSGCSSPCLDDKGTAIAIDGAGNAYVTGEATSVDFPVTPGAFRTKFLGEWPFVTKIDPTGSALAYSTYINPGQYYVFQEFNQGNAIAVNGAGNAYVTGFTDSCHFPVTPDAFQKVNGICFLGGNSSNRGVFVSELNQAGSSLVYSTLLSGTDIVTVGDVGNGIALDAFGDAYVTGSTGSTNFPVTDDAFRKINHAPGYPRTNAFLTKLNANGSALFYSTYVGGGGAGINAAGDIANAVAVDAFGNPVITGGTCSSDFPVTARAFETVNNAAEVNPSGGCETFITRFRVNTATGTILTSDANPQKAGVKVRFTAAVTANTEGAPVPTGFVVFSIDGTPVLTSGLDDTGRAAYSTSALDAGRYTITAMYLGSSTDSPSSGDLGQLILGNPARITVASGTYQTGVEGSPFAMPLVVQVQDARGVPVPGAVVNFSGTGLTFAGNPAVTNVYGQASVVATPTATGSLTAAATIAGVSPTAFRLTATQPGP